MQLIVYDEIHYLRDKERGVVWEESIIMAPKTARFVFLSATIPNAREFAEWIAKTHRSPCHVVYTDYRPTPLQHYLFPSGAQGLYMVVDEKGNHMVLRLTSYHICLFLPEVCTTVHKGKVLALCPYWFVFAVPSVRPRQLLRLCGMTKLMAI